MKVAFVVHDAGINALGRAHSLSLLVEELGWTSRAGGYSTTGALWPVVAGTDFAEQSQIFSDDAAAARLIAWADVVIAVKLLPRSFGLARRLCAEAGKPLVLDVDDPDLEMHTSEVLRKTWSRPRVLARRVSRLGQLYMAARRVPRMTSNPVLRRRWGGVIIPHVRPVRPSIPAPASRDTLVAFVGTVRPHKGVEPLRQAVADLAPSGYRLVITDAAPHDAAPWEDWQGRVGLAEGLRLLDSCHIAAVPSLARGYAKAQLPVKMIDAMSAGRVVVATDMPPIRWALADAGLLCRPGSPEALRVALERAGDRELGPRLGAAARARALRLFTPAAVAPSFRSVIEAAITAGPS